MILAIFGDNIHRYRKEQLKNVVKRLKKDYDKWVNNSIIIFQTNVYIKNNFREKFVYIRSNNFNSIFDMMEKEIEYRYYPVKYTFYTDGKDLRESNIYESETEIRTCQRTEYLFRKLKKDVDVEDFEKLIEEKRENLSSKEIDKYTESVLSILRKG